MRVFPASLLVPGCLLATSPLAAQSVPGPIPGPLDLPQADDGTAIVVTANRTERPLTQVTEAVTVIDAAEIRQRQPLVVTDLLRTVPGITVTRNGGFGAVSGVSIRGASADQTLVLIDGVRINDPSAPAGGFNFGDLVAGQISRVEVVRGTPGVIWGSQAIGGVVNLLTAAPTDSPRLDLRAEGGWRSTANLSANASGALGPVRASLGGSYLRTDNISAFAGGTERDGYRNAGAHARVEVALTDALGLDLRGFTTDARTEFDGFAPPTFALGDTDDRTHSKQLVGYAGVNLALLDGRLRNRAAYTITRIDRTDEDGVGVETFDATGRTERVEYQGVATLSPGTEAVFGAEREWTRSRTEGFGSVDRAERALTSVYGQLSATPLERLTLTGGARYDDHESFGGRTTLGGGAVWSPGAVTLRVNYGEGFKVPSLFQLASGFGNDALEPERARSYEAGAALRLADGRVTLGATAWRRDTRDLIVFVGCFEDPRPICVGRPFGTYDNVARARAEGVELTGEVRPVPALSIRGEVSLIDATDRDSGLALARRPKQTVGVLADYRWPFGLETGVTVLHVADSFDDASERVRLDGYVTADVRAALPLGDRLELTGRITNLFDAAYQTAARYGQPGRAAFAGVRVMLGR